MDVWRLLVKRKFYLLNEWLVVQAYPCIRNASFEIHSIYIIPNYQDVHYHPYFQRHYDLHAPGLVRHPADP